MSLKIRRGTNAERLTITPVEGELIYTTDTKNLYVGDGIIAGGKFITGPGYTGSIGYTGSRGYIGSQGNIGYVGSASTIIGYTGSVGYAGSAGLNGGTLVSNLNTSTYNITNGTTLSINGSTGDIIANTVRVSTNEVNIAKFTGAVNGVENSVSLHGINGSISNPLTLQPGDYGVNLRFSTVSNVVGQEDVGKSLAVFLPRIDPNANMSNSAPKSNLIIIVGAGDGLGDDPTTNYRAWKFGNDGSFTTKILQAVATSSTNISGITPTQGMIVFDSTAQKFKGYVSDTGTASGGASNSSPGWVNLN